MGITRNPPHVGNAQRTLKINATTKVSGKYPDASRSPLFFQEAIDREHGCDENTNSDTIIVCPSRTLKPMLLIGRPESVRELLVETNPAGGGYFKQLPLEIHQEFVSYLLSDREVAAYARVTKQTREAISSSVWYKRFNECFDKIDGLDIDVLADKYIKRRAFFKKWITFDIKRCGGSANREICEKQWEYQEECLSRLTDLILESRATKKTNDNGEEIILDKNMQFIRDLTCGRRANRVGSYLDILDTLLEDDYTIPPRRKSHEGKPQKQERIAIIQLCLSSVILHPEYCITKVSHFDLSQRQVYASEARHPLFKGRYKQEVNIFLLLHTINFFKFHFKAGSGEGILSDAYQALSKDQYPQTWLGHIKPGTQELGSYWKGTYTWLDHPVLARLRAEKSDGDIYSDSVDDESLVEMTLAFDTCRFPMQDWPPGFEDILDTNPFDRIEQAAIGRRLSPRSKRHQGFIRPEIKQFLGRSMGAKDGYIFGRLHALNNQQEIHGWQRITFLKFFADANGEYDADQVWAYEGVVLPGGRMIVGRWRDALAGPADSNTQLSGPFIFWNVDISSTAPSIEAEEVVEFSKTIIDPRLSLPF